MNIDDLVRTTLRSYADEAPPNAGLLAAANARAQRRQVRHTVLAVAAGAAAGLVAVSIPLAGAVDNESTQVSAPPSGHPPVDLAEAPDFELPPFPFTPGWTPAGVHAPYVSYDGLQGMRVLRLVLDVADQPIPSMSLIHPAESVQVLPPLAVGVYSDDPTTQLDTFPAEPITVHDREGKVYRIRTELVSGSVVVWRHAPKQWVAVWGSGIDSLDVVRYAERLEPEPIYPQLPFTFGLLPAGVELTGFDPFWMRFQRDDVLVVDVRVIVVDSAYATATPGPGGPTDWPTDLPTDPPLPSASPSAAPPTPIEVAGRPGLLFPLANVVRLRIQLDEGRILAVDGSHINPHDLIRIAEGIEITHHNR